MKVYVLTTTSCCGDRLNLGVYDSWAAVMHRLSWVGDHIDPRDEYNVECFMLRDAEFTGSEAAEILESRAERKQREAAQANQPTAN